MMARQGFVFEVNGVDVSTNPTRFRAGLRFNQSQNKSLTEQ